MESDEHLLNVMAFTFCLICDLNINKEKVKRHIRSGRHKKNQIRLFKFCMDVEEPFPDDHLQLVKGSKYDLQNEKCYMRLNKTHLVCFLCREEVSKTELPLKKIKKRVVSHLQSDRHLKSVKDSNWIFYFKSKNSNNSFFRFHQSLLYCSICKDSFQFEKSSILQFADSHLKSHEKVSLICSNKDFLEHSVITKKYPRIKVLADCHESFRNNSKFIQINETLCFCSLCEAMVRFDADQFNMLNNFVKHFASDEHLKRTAKCYTCHLCLGDIEITERGVLYSIGNHCDSNHKYKKSQIMDIIVFNEAFVDLQELYEKNPQIEALSDCHEEFKKNVKFIRIVETMMFCSLCKTTVAYNEHDTNQARNFLMHFLDNKHQTNYSKVKGSTTGFKDSKGRPHE